MTALGQFDAALLLIDREVAILLLDLEGKLGNQSVNGFVKLRAVFYRTRDNEGRARLVDQDRVDLVDNRKRQFSLTLVCHAKGHVVAQIVKAKFIVSAVHHIAAIGCFLVFCILPGAHHTYSQA